MTWEAVGVIAAIVLGVANLAWQRVTWRQQAEGQAAVEALQRQQSDATLRLAEALERMERRQRDQPLRTRADDPPSERRHTGISARLDSTGKGHPRIVLVNEGPVAALVVDVQVLGRPQAILTPSRPSGVELPVGREHAVSLAADADGRAPLRLLVRWLDEGGAQTLETTVG